MLTIGKDLPPYPWQRQRLWSESAASVKRRTQLGEHTLLDLQQEVPHSEWHTQLAGSHLKFLHDHVVDEQVRVPFYFSILVNNLYFAADFTSSSFHRCGISSNKTHHQQ